MAKYGLGAEYGSHGVHAVMTDLDSRGETVSAYSRYKSEIVSLSDGQARRHPSDYICATKQLIPALLEKAASCIDGFSAEDVISIGIATCGSAAIPMDRSCQPLAMAERFENDPDAMTWLEEDLVSTAEAHEITDLTRRTRPHFLSGRSDIYFAEDFFSRILHCARNNSRVFDAAYSWTELSDWIPASLTGGDNPSNIALNISAAGFKAMFNGEKGGWPDEQFLKRFDPKLAELRSRLPAKASTIGSIAGILSAKWASDTGLPEGIVVSTGGLIPHMSAIGCGVAPGVLVKYLSGDSCDVSVVPSSPLLPDIPGLTGKVPDGIIPGFTGIQATNSATGLVLDWFFSTISGGNSRQEEMFEQAASLKPGQNGILSLNWHDGNLSPLFSDSLSGLTIGQTLQTTSADIFRALIEAPAFETRALIQRLRQYNIEITEVVTTGPLAAKYPCILRIYADIIGIPISVAGAARPAAFGAAISGIVAAGKMESIPVAIQSLVTKTGTQDPDPTAGDVYKKLFKLYKQLFDAFGTTSWKGNCHNVMKQLADIRNGIL